MIILSDDRVYDILSNYMANEMDNDACEYIFIKAQSFEETINIINDYNQQKHFAQLQWFKKPHFGMLDKHTHTLK